MKKTIEKFGIPILMVFIVIIYILNNISGVEDKLIIVNYSIIFFNFIAWIISIIRAVKEKRKNKIIPCIIITILAILSFILSYNMIFPDFYIQLFAQIGLAIFMYEIIDLFKVRLYKNIINIFSLIISIVIIITFLLSQLVTISKYKESLNNISNFITSPDLTYEKLSSEFEPLILEHQSFNDFTDEIKDKSFITPAYYYKGLYGWAVEGLKDISINNIKNKSTFKKYRQDLNEKMEWLMNAMNNNLDAINKEIATSLFIAILEIIMVISIGILNNKKVKNNIEN